jgi:hypothetical protein
MANVETVNDVNTTGDLFNKFPMKLKPLIDLLMVEISQMVAGETTTQIIQTKDAAGNKLPDGPKVEDIDPTNSSDVMMQNEMFGKFCEAIAKAVLGYLRDHGSLRLSAIEQAMADITFLASNNDPNTFLKGQSGLDVCVTMTPGTDPEGDNRGTFAIPTNI